MQAQHSKLLDVCAARRQALPPALDRLLDLEAEMELRAALRGWRLVSMKQVREEARGGVECGEGQGILEGGGSKEGGGQLQEVERRTDG